MRGNSGTQGVIPLRTILRNFLNLVENCEASVKDGLDLYEKEFQELKQFSENLKSDTSHLCKEGEKNVNRKKNRYKDILPFDYTRVILGDYGDVPGSDYINANFIKGASGSSAYIACQGPLPHTVNDFWRMVVECEVQVIVMACNEQESGKHKCENYWVEEEAVEREFGQVTVWLKKCRQVCPDFLVRTMRIRYTNCKGETEERNVCQFHYSAWPDHGVPSKVRPLLEMVRLIRDCQTSETLPVLVHCSAGCGRTGTICAIDYVWGLLRLGKLTPDFSLFYLVRDMRRQRIAMVQTKDQYVLVHRAVKELFEEQLKIIDSHPYANVDQNGLPLDIKSDLEEPTYETVEFHSSDEQSNALCASVEPPPALPSTKRDIAMNSKLEKEVENHCKHHEQERYNMKGAVASGSHSPFQKLDEIVVLSSDCDEKAEKEKESIGEKVNSHTSKPSRTSLLRKPSIVKLKAFFEKSKDDKKTGSTQLSRAKSDVSSRFINFASSFNSRGHSPPIKISSPIQPSAFSGGSESSPHEKSKSKPALLAKPALPIKRSKSLKIGKGESIEGITIQSSSKSKLNELSSSLSPTSTPNVSSASGFSTVTNNPIKVCVKQVDIPKLQKIVSKSVKPEAQTATTYELLRESSKNSTDEIDSPKSRGGNEELKSFPSKKPVVPSKAHILKDNNNYVNLSYSPTKIKMGVSKEMEDSTKKGTKSPKFSRLKKYDTVTPKSMTTLNLGTSLTRSQSNVWQPNKVQRPVRIFSDENIHQSGSLAGRNFLDYNGISKNTGNGNSSPYSEINDFHYDPNTHQRLSDVAYKQNGSQDNSRTLLRRTSLTSNGLQTERECSPEKPTVRRRVPKTNPYANYIPSGGSLKYSSQAQSPFASQLADDNTNPVQISQTYLGENASKDLPNLKISYSRSRENSSESSSNTGTPRSSLPGTPTQTIDPAYSQLIKTNLQGIGSNTKRIIGNGNVPPKSILKGSLSSTPSESDERLDSIRHNGYPAQSAKPNIITAPQKISTVRIAVGNRERRDSFRQAVWKEDQPSINGNMDVQESPSNSYIFPIGTRKGTEISNSILTGPSHRTHKDYEPIWPTSSTGMSNNHVRTGSSSFYISSDDHEPSKSQSSQIMDRSLLFNPSSFGPGPPQYQGLPMSKRSHSEERTQFGENKSQPGLQIRFDENKFMLDELRAPIMNQSSASDRNAAAHILKQREFDKIPLEKPSASTTNLRHQRSLRAPSRPQYQQGLSCFTFRKPSSFESITDQLHAEEYQSFTSGLSPSSYAVDNSEQNRTHPISENAPTKGRHVNDYVSLRQCRTSSQQREPEYFSPIENTAHENWRQDFTSTTPIPPPRTKKLQQNARKESTGSNSKLSENSPGPSSSGWARNNVDNHQGSSNLPEIVRCTKFAEDNQGTTDPQNNGNPTSPKVMVRALGMFQAKAANMRSRFANWTEAKDRGSPKRGNGTLLTKDNDPKDDTSNDGGFLPSVTSATQLPCPSRSKHQYL